ncbi:MAG: DUF1232 domain-containing protein, partial [Planctomycetes bacterium]|nr:DUF1232 domain-containing protein [Planctomycetota bacterium]
MMQCPSCRQEIGMNRTCRECMGHMTREGAKRLDGAKIREIAAKGRAWLAARGGDAPPELREKTERLLSFLEPRIAGGANLPEGDPGSLAAFAVHYVVSPQDLAPDVVPGVGWSDDLLVADFALEAVAPPA